MIESVQVRQRGAIDFGTHYENLCALQDACPLAAVKAHLTEGVLDLNGDRLRANDWSPLLDTLRINKSLEFVAFRSFYSPPNTDSDKNVPVPRKKMPAIRSKDVTYRLCKALRECLTVSPTLSCLELQGLSLRERDLTTLTKGLFKNTALRHLSLEYCHIGDAGLDTICRGIKNSTTINSLNLTGCCLSWKGAESLSKVIKHQAMKRHNEAWRDSLRYRRPDLDRMPGIRRITINNNPLLGDQGAILLAEALKDDLWLKALDLQCCGISSSGARTLLEVLKYNTTIVVLDVRRNPLVDRDVLHSIMEQLMLNCNGQDTEYKWIKAEENPETAKPSAKAAVTKKRRTKTLNISFGRKTTIKVPLSSARRRTRSAGSANGGVRNTSIRQASGLPWRTAARANRHRGFPPEHDPRCSSMYEGIDGLAPLDSLRPDVSVILTHEDSQREDTFGELDKLDLEESNLNAEAKGVRGVRVEFELLRRRLKEETEARKIAERRNMELSLENQRLKGKLVDRGSILEDDQVLESIENTFRQFHNFLDLLRDAGLGSLITMAGLDQDSMPFAQPSMSLSQTSRNGIPGNVSMKDPKLSTTLPRHLSAAQILKKNPEDRFAGDITSGVQVSTSCGSFEEGLPLAFGPESQQRTSAGIVMSDLDSVPDPAMAGLDARDDYAADLQAMKVDDLYERLVQDTRDVLNTDWDSKLQETQSKAKAKQPVMKRLTKHTDEPKLSKEQDIDALSQLSKGDMPLPGVTASMDTLAESESINVSVAKSVDGGEHGDHAEPNKEHPGSRFLKGASDRNLTTPDLKSVQSEGNYSMDGFEQSYLSDRGEVVQDIDILGSLTPSLPKDNSDEDDF